MSHLNVAIAEKRPPRNKVHSLAYYTLSQLMIVLLKLWMTPVCEDCEHSVWLFQFPRVLFCGDATMCGRLCYEVRNSLILAYLVDKIKLYLHNVV